MIIYKCCQNCPNAVHNGGSGICACTLPCYEEPVVYPVIIMPITVPNYSSTAYPSWYYNSVTTSTTIPNYFNR